MKKLKIVLHSRGLYLGLLGLSVLNFFWHPITSLKEQSYAEVTGSIKEFLIDGDSLELTLVGKEKVKVFYTIATKKEKEQLETTLGYDDVATFTGSFTIPIEDNIPNVFSYSKYLELHHFTGVMYAKTIQFQPTKNILAQWKSKVYRYLKTLPNYEYLAAFVLGNKQYIDMEEIRKTGISHLFSVSGMHLLFLASILSKFIQRKKGYQEVILLLFLWLYAYFVSFSVSVLRAVLFYTFTRINQRWHLELSSKQLFFLCFLLLLSRDPFSIFDLGFQYSFFITFGLLFWYKPKRYFWQNLWHMSVFTTFLSLPITAMNFYEINLMSVFSNMFFVPFVTYLFYPLCLLTIFIPFFSFLLSICCPFFTTLTHFFSCCSFGRFSIPKVSSVYWLIYLLFFWRVVSLHRKKDILFLGGLLFLLVLFPKFDSHLKVQFLDVGQGDAILFISPHQRQVALLDTGGRVTYAKKDWQTRQKTNYQAQELVTYLHSLGIQSLDYLLLSHGDADHMGNALYLVQNLPVKHVFFNCGASNELEMELQRTLDVLKITYTKCPSSFLFDGIPFTFLNSSVYENENDNSMVLYTNFYGYQFLFMGDAETKREAQLLNDYTFSQIDVLKVGHHGSKTSTSPEFVAKIKPKYAIISVGKNNRYGHPNNEVLHTLFKSKVYRTDQLGSIFINMTQNSFLLTSNHK